MALETDVVLVGAGNAALCAALSARERGADVVVLERAPIAERGGNTGFTAGSMRVAYDSVSQLLELMPDLTEDERARTDFEVYTETDFFDDLATVSQYRADGDLIAVLAERSFSTLKWMQSKGIRFIPQYGRQSFNVNGQFEFFGGLALEASGGGLGLLECLIRTAEQVGIKILYDSRVTGLLHTEHGVRGVTGRQKGRGFDISAAAVVLASGGFEADPAWRAQYLGPGWDVARVRGTRFNTGDGIKMALDLGAAPYGHWSGCHAVNWDYNAPEFGDLSVRDGFQKHSFPFGIMVNAEGRRFVDEGADFWSNTYANYGHLVLEQPGRLAWQIFDRKVAHLLRDEYRIREVTKVTAPTIAELACKLIDVKEAEVLQTIREFNDAVEDDIAFNPNTKDGRCTRGLAIPKSNWANKLDEPPFEAYQVTCGISFTFGGLRITPRAEVVDADGGVIHGLYAAGELVGGLYYFNCPAGVGLTSGAVFGRIAGAMAAEQSRQSPS